MTTTPEPKRASISVSTAVVLGFLLLGLGWGIGYGSTILWRSAVITPQRPPAATTVLPPELDLRYQLLKNQLDNAADNSKQLDRLVTLLLTLTSLYAFALGLNSYFGLKQILDTGKEDLARLREFVKESRTELVTFRGELREKYPELANLHTNLHDVLGGIRLMFQPGRDWIRQYADLGYEERERLHVAEMRLAGLEVFRLGELDTFRDDVRRVYQGLGRFYSSRYKSEKLVNDWERGSLYFQSAIQLDRSKRPSGLLKDLGVHLTLIEQIIDARVAASGGTDAPTPAEQAKIEALRIKAADFFRESLEVNSKEAGSLFGLGWLFYKSGDWPNAIAQYAALTELTEWLPGDKAKYVEEAWFNQACCHVRGASANATDAAYTKALAALEESRKVAVDDETLPQWKVKVNKEAVSGDLQKLQTSRPAELKNLLV